jgi:hypothetical protein
LCRKDCGRTSSHAARTARTADAIADFVAVDGEGVDVERWQVQWIETEDGFMEEQEVKVEDHYYVLLSVGAKSLHHNGDQLQFAEVMEFLYGQFVEQPDATFVGYYLGYDFAQWLRTIPDTKAWRLLHSKGIASRSHSNPDVPIPWPVTYSGWDFDILGTKRFKLRPHVRYEDRILKTVVHRDGTMTERRIHPHKWMYICDSGSYFQTSLMKAIDPKDWNTPIVTDTEFSILQEGKDRRDIAQLDEDMIRYNLLENDVLPRLMSQIDQGLRADGIRLSRHKWFGPGQAAQAWLGLAGCPTGDEVREAVPEEIRIAARESYYGGWFEIFLHGLIPGQTHAYDINSAYPHIIRNLPCLLHGVWKTSRTYQGRTLDTESGYVRRYILVRAIVRGRDPRIGAMPHRRPDGTILRPSQTGGWYWAHELEAAQSAGLISAVKVFKTYEYHPCACPPPLRSIEDLYQGRLEVGKNTPYGKAKKVVYNSAYGKMAQSIGQPKYSNPLYASLITAGCRTMILQAIASHPHKSAAVAMVATDSITFLTEHPTINLHDTELGAWDHTVHHNLSLMMPGLYWDDTSRATIREGKAPKVKSRGVPAKDLANIIDDIDQQWVSLREEYAAGMNDVRIVDPDEIQWPTKDIHLKFAMVSAKLAAAQNRWQDCGRVLHDSVRTINADPRNKRATFYYDRSLRSGSTLLVSDPYQRIDKEPWTTPYDKGFGEQPIMVDWKEREIEELLTPDGFAIDGIRGVIPD